MLVEQVEDIVQDGILVVRVEIFAVCLLAQDLHESLGLLVRVGDNLRFFALFVASCFQVDVKDRELGDRVAVLGN